jgi:ABC-type proline/glycine betaine transport system permease subunit
MDEITTSFLERGDLAHLALFLWASGASSLLVWTLRELIRSNRRFNDFVTEIARLNQTIAGRRP